MNEVYELELWSRPRALLPLEYGKELEKEVNLKLSLPKGIFSGLSLVYSDTDRDNLLHALNEKELKHEQFLVFCKMGKFEPSANNKESAARFLEFSYGRALAWLHIPHTPSGLKYYSSLLAWATENKFNIQCGNKLYCVNHHNESRPLNW